MTDTSSSPGVGARVPSQSSGAMTTPSGWVGWIAFAAIMMITVGSLHAIQGLVALFKDDYYLVSRSGLVVSIDYTAWGWVHLLVGVLVAVAGASLLAGRTWARVVGVLFALVSLVINFAFVAAYPIWSICLITVDILVIYALIVHGREMRDLR